MTAAAPYRCSLSSRTLEESPAGTASTVRAFVLLEEPGPWGVDATRDSRLPEEVRTHLRALTRSGVRPLLVRRPGSRAAEETQLFAATGGDLWRTSLADVRDVLDLDLTGLRQGQVPPPLSPTDEPVFLVCTHGRHDACCAEWGRPLAAAMTAAAPDLAWEVSHIGGDRFAPNLLVLPEGLYYGRLEPARADAFVAEHLAGRLDLEHLRGRSAFPFAVQAAEIHLRRHLDDRRLAPYRLVRHERDQRLDGTTDTTAVFDVDGAHWEARVRSHPGPAHRLTCRAEREEAAPVHELLGLTDLDAA